MTACLNEAANAVFIISLHWSDSLQKSKKALEDFVPDREAFKICI